MLYPRGGFTELIDRIRRDDSAHGGRWLLLGHSMGGKVASVVARRALAGDDPASGKLVSDEPIAECGVIGVDVAGSVDQVCVVPIPL